MMTRIQLPLRRSALALLCLAAVASNGAAEGAADDFKVIDGVLVQPLVLPDHDVAQIAADGGATYYVDLRSLPRDPVRLEARTPITVVGYQGERPDLISAHVLKLREVPPPPPHERGSVDLRVIEGKIASMTRETLMLRTTTGMVPVRIGGLSARFIAGEIVRVLGVLAGDDTFAANALILQSPSGRDVDANKGRNER
jgi:hypothetical protein